MGAYRLLADQIIEKFNPADEDVAEVAILLAKIDAISDYVQSLPCTCPPNAGPPDWDVDPCERCQVLGHAKNKAVDW